MKVVVTGRKKAFWAGKLRKPGEIVDVPSKFYNDEKIRGSWMGKPKQKKQDTQDASDTPITP